MGRKIKATLKVLKVLMIGIIGFAIGLLSNFISVSLAIFIENLGGPSFAVIYTNSDVAISFSHNIEYSSSLLGVKYHSIIVNNSFDDAFSTLYKNGYKTYVGLFHTNEIYSISTWFENHPDTVLYIPTSHEILDKAKNIVRISPNDTNVITLLPIISEELYRNRDSITVVMGRERYDYISVLERSFPFVNIVFVNETTYTILASLSKQLVYILPDTNFIPYPNKNITYITDNFRYTDTNILVIKWNPNRTPLSDLLEEELEVDYIVGVYDCVSIASGNEVYEGSGETGAIMFSFGEKYGDRIYQTYIVYEWVEEWKKKFVISDVERIGKVFGRIV